MPWRPAEYRTVSAGIFLPLPQHGDRALRVRLDRGDRLAEAERHREVPQVVLERLDDLLVADRVREPGQRGPGRAVGRRRPAGQHGLRRGRGERGREHRDPAQHRPVGLVEQGVAPVERGPERTVPVVRARTAGQQVHPVGQPGFDPVQAERRDAGGGQLDRQRHAVKTPADGRDPGGIRLRQRAPGRGGAGQEQLHRVTRAAVAGRDAQARHREHPLERHQQPGAAGDQHRQPRAAREQPLEQHRHPVQQVLAVVQDQQRLPRRQPAEHGVLGRTGLALAEAERGRDGRARPWPDR